MDLDSAPEPGVELIRGPRRPVEIAPGYIVPIGAATAAVAAVAVAVFAPTGSRILLGVAVFLLGVLIVFTAVNPVTVRRHRLGRDVAAGLPLAELGPTGARLRYELPTPRERRTGEPGAKRRYDAAVAWADVTGWRRGVDPFGAPVLVLEVSDPARVTVRGRAQLTQLTGMYLDHLREGLGSATVIRIPLPPAEQAAVAFLTARGLLESPASPPPDWPVDGGAIVRRGVAEISGGRAWPARSLRDILRSRGR